MIPAFFCFVLYQRLIRFHRPRYRQ